MDRPSKPRQRSQAFSYVELCIAIIILGMCIIPAAQALPALMAAQRDLETRFQLSLVAQEKLDQAKLELENSFSARDESGDLTVQGHPEWRYHLVVTVPPEGGGRYAIICSQAWADEDSDTQLDADEPQARFDLLVANRGWSL